MTDSQVNGVLARLDGLEQDNRRMKRSLRTWRFGGLAALSAAAVFTIAAAETSKVADEVRAKRIVVVDSAGKPRVELTLETAVQGLAVRDKDGKLRVAVGVNASEGQLNDASGLAVFEKNEKVVLTMGSNADGAAALGIYDPAKPGSLTEFAAPRTLVAPGQIAIMDAEGKPRVAAAAQEGQPNFVVLDAEGKPLFQAPAK